MVKNSAVEPHPETVYIQVNTKMIVFTVRCQSSGPFPKNFGKRPLFWSSCNEYRCILPKKLETQLFLCLKRS